MFEFLTQSTWVDRFGWMLVHSLWQFALLALVAVALGRVLRRSPATTRYGALLAAMSLIVVAPVATWFSPWSADASASAAKRGRAGNALIASPPQHGDAPLALGSPPALSPWEAAANRQTTPLRAQHAATGLAAWRLTVKAGVQPWLPQIVLLWLAGVVVVAIRPLLSWHTVRRLRTVGVSPVAAAVQSVLERAAVRLGLTSAVAVLQSTLVHAPVVLGYFRPVILLPACVVTGLPAAQLESILAHELAHIRRHDYLVNLLQTLVETLFFYHPAVWWLSRQIRNERENCCDDAAMAAVGSRADYGRALLAIEELRATPTGFSLAAGGGSLLARMRRVAGCEPPPSVVAGGSILGLVLVSLAIVGAGLWDAAPAAEKTAAGAEKAAKVLAQGAAAVPNASTVHIVATIRTLPQDNFSLIGAEFPFVPIEVWNQAGEKPKWRVQKPLRVVVMDGASTVMLIRNEFGAKLARATQGAFDTGWILGLAKAQGVMTHEMQTARARGWDAELTHQTAPTGEKQLVLTVEAKAQPPENLKDKIPDFSLLKNHFFEFSDMRRVYRFDAKSQRLAGMEAYLHRPDGDVLVFKIKTIEYGQPIAPALFSLKVPENVQWFDDEPARRPDGAKRNSADGGFWRTRPAAEQEAAAVMSRLAETAPSPSTVHVVAKMRTEPGDNFSSIDVDGELVPVEVWRQFGPPSKSRIDKPGRVIVVDGISTVALMRSENMAIKFPFPTNGALDSYPLLSLASVKERMTEELRGARFKGWRIQVAHETAAAGAKKIVVTVEAKAGVPDNDVVRNAFFDNSDMRRVYRFDAKTERLESIEGYLHLPGRELLVLTTERIEYDRPIAPAVFTLKLPENVQWWKEPQSLPDNEKYEKMTPAEAARAFFEACAKKNWDEAQKFAWPLDERFKSYLGGLQIVRLGTPFQSKSYGGWFIPYEIKLTMKATFMVCNDNPAKRYVVFGPGNRPDAKRLARLAELKPLADHEKYAKLTPKEIVRALLEADAKKDVGEAQKFLDDTISIADIKKEMEGPPIIGFRVGEPSAAKEPGRWEVPVEITAIKKHNLAVRNDNPANRYVVDGGI